MTSLKSLFLILLFAHSVTTVKAAQKSGKQNMASGPGTYRVELRNIGMLKVWQVGDPNPPGELAKVNITLKVVEVSGNHQYNNVLETSPAIYNFTRGAMGGSGNISIYRGDRLRLGRDGAPRSDYNLWAHGRRTPSSSGGIPKLRIRVTINARELDCTGQRKCRRGNTSITTYFIDVPGFTEQPPRTCTSENTFKLTTVDDKAAVIVSADSHVIGNSIWVDRRIRSHTPVADLSYWGPGITIDNADLCVARTWR